jgi:plastocyanin
MKSKQGFFCIKCVFTIGERLIESFVLYAAVELPRGVSLLSRLVVILCALSGLTLSEAAETFTVQLPGTRADPELLTVNQGDTVMFAWSAPAPGLTESYTGEWSTILNPGQSFSYTFTKPGTYVYRTQYGAAYYPGVIKVQAVTDAYPAIWITRPLDNFIVPGYTDIEAATTNSPQSVKVVNFYANGQLVGSAASSPFVVSVDFSTQPGTYDMTASVVDTGGATNTSTPVRITFDTEQLFQPWRLPQGQTVIFVSTAGIWCIYSSGDLNTWKWQPVVKGNSVVVDETTTNVPERFYYVKQCGPSF